jgi:tRNA modification GTPase
MAETIFALSSGPPPAAISIIRISGPDAGRALDELAGTRPKARQASTRRLVNADGSLLDQALVLWLPGPGTSTGEDTVELHLHGGRAVVAAVETALVELPAFRRAEPGEFTRRAFANGRIDLAEAEGLADLLSAETELQRRQALALASGELSTVVRGWRDAVLMASAQVEAVLDFGDEEDVDELPPEYTAELQTLVTQIRSYLDQPRAELLRDGFRVVLAGPPNSGKSSLFNRLVADEAAITAPIAGTTRDVLSRPVQLAGIPFVFIDTAGLREDADDSIEAIGIDRARGELAKADLVLWMGEQGQGEGRLVWDIESFADRTPLSDQTSRHRISAISGFGVPDLVADLIGLAQATIATPGRAALNKRHYSLLQDAEEVITSAMLHRDLLIVAELLRQARSSFDHLLGQAGTEEMLDALFSRFCIGK